MVRGELSTILSCFSQKSSRSSGSGRPCVILSSSAPAPPSNLVDAFERGAVESAGGDEDVDEAGLFERGVEGELSGLAGDEAS